MSGYTKGRSTPSTAELVARTATKLARLRISSSPPKTAKINRSQLRWSVDQ